MARVPRTVQYRYLNRSVWEEGKGSLVEAIRAAMQSTRDGDLVGKTARARVADLEQSGQMTILNGINGLEAVAPAFSGQLILYRKGFDVPAIEEQLEKADNSFKIVQFQTDGKSKPIEGVLYFVVIGDHIGMITSSVVSGRWLERYLTWLLKDIGSVLEGESRVELNAQIEVDSDGPYPEGTKQLTVHALSNKRQEGATPGWLAEHAKGAGATVLDILKLLGFDDDAVEDLASNVPEGGSLEGDFRVFIKRGRSRVDISADTLDHAFRNIESEGLDVKGTGGKLAGGLLKLSEPVRVLTTESWLDPEDAVHQIMNSLYTWASQGRIDLKENA